MFLSLRPPYNLLLAIVAAGLIYLQASKFKFSPENTLSVVLVDLETLPAPGPADDQSRAKAYEDLLESNSTAHLRYPAITSITEDSISPIASVVSASTDNSEHDTIQSNWTSKTVAAIVEDRPLSNFLPVVLHFAAVLGPDWPIVVFTRRSKIPASAPVLRDLQAKRIFVRYLSEDMQFPDHAAVSIFLTRPWLWEQLAPADHVLLFQADSMICANSLQRVEDFLEWDLIGAPIDPIHGNGYNGGLSLRNRTMILDIISSSNFEEGSRRAALGAPGNPDRYEDQWFYKQMSNLPRKKNGQPGAKLPPEWIAAQFAVESVFHDRPLGYHQPGRYQRDNLEEIEEWCPEVRMIL